MWNAILNWGGWALFFLVLLFYVRWIALERAFFSGRDPEARGDGLELERFMADHRHLVDAVPRAEAEVTGSHQDAVLA
ncbi:MAG TPA: hypothetical protein VLT62_22395 [Candidatus Methylomirabilis sp.]|nr:hypothetical protein [Candidatus Methylomirabilis sp.]